MWFIVWLIYDCEEIIFCLGMFFVLVYDLFCVLFVVISSEKTFYSFSVRVKSCKIVFDLCVFVLLILFFLEFCNIYLDYWCLIFVWMFWFFRVSRARRRVGAFNSFSCLFWWGMLWLCMCWWLVLCLLCCVFDWLWVLLLLFLCCLMCVWCCEMCVGVVWCCCV